MPANELCLCVKRQLVHSFLGEELGGSGVRKSGLDTRTSARVRGPWAAVRPALSYALGAAYERSHWQFRFKSVTDRDVVAGYLAGADKFASDSAPPPTPIREVLDARCDLIILRTGFLAARNKEAAGYVAQALLDMDADKRRLWLVEDPKRPFAAGYLGWSEHIDCLLADWEVFDFGKVGA